jgi:alpha-tubulin suppressor-like RCC1 family protein
MRGEGHHPYQGTGKDRRLSARGPKVAAAPEKYVRKSRQSGGHRAAGRLAVLGFSVAAALLLSACNFFGVFDNPVDPGAQNYQGFLSVSVKELALGGDHVLLVSGDGTVYAWGENYDGQLGLGNSDETWSPEEVADLSNIEGAAAGGSHSIVWDGDGNLWGWGSNAERQLYGPPEEGYDSPEEFNLEIKMAAARDSFTAYLEPDGSISAQGKITQGHDDDAPVVFDSDYQDISISNGSVAAKKLVCNEWGLMAIAEDESVWRWGVFQEDGSWHGSFEQVTGVTASDAAGGGGHFLVLETDGSLTRVGEFHAVDSGGPPAGTSFTDVAAGHAYSLAVTENGELWGWGSNDRGCLGLPYWQFELNEPSRIDENYKGNKDYTGGLTLDFTGARLYADDSTTFIALSDDSLIIWGENDWGQHATGSTDNPNMREAWFEVDFSASGSAPDGIADADGWGDFGIAVDLSGNVWGWGANNSGQLGLGDTAFRMDPEMISGLGNIAEIAAGWEFVVARVPGGSVYTWGENGSGQLGTDDYTEYHSPQSVGSLWGGCVDLDCGREHSLTLWDDAGSTRVYAWGGNASGQLGLGDTTMRGSPEQVTGFDAAVEAVACGYFHSLALDENGNVWAWGSNRDGQLGDGSTTDRTAPHKLSSSLFGGEAVKAIAAGGDISVAITENGHLYGWGLNSGEQLGYDSPEVLPDAVKEPERMGDFDSVKAATVGGNGVVFVTELNEVYFAGHYDFEGGREGGDLFTKSDFWSSLAVENLDGGGSRLFFINDNNILYAF